ncbi:MAG: translocation/assembly module TamB domain-containing protein, partial [Chitinophagaceae bacterium]|nr:translocation/assembly module TamB domain-containing protein [Chitinophagaceae bacterium]
MRLSWWNSLSLKRVYLGDTRKNALLSSGSLEVSFNLLDLISNKLTIKKVDWDDILINVYRLPGDATYNYQFIIDAFASGAIDTTAATGEPMIFSVGDVSITNCRMRFMDAPGGIETNVKWKSLLLDPEEIKPESSLYNINRLQVDGLRGIVDRKFIVTPLLQKEVEKEVTNTDEDPVPMLVKAGNIDFNDCDIWYSDEAAGLNTNLQVGDFEISNALFDPSKSTIQADNLKLHTTTGGLALGEAKTPKDTVTTVVATDTAAAIAWVFKVKNIDFDSIGLRYDKLGTASQASGMDLNHIDITGFRLQAENLGYYTDSILVNLNDLKLRDRSGFAIKEGQAEILYSDKIIALRNLLFQTNKSRLASEIVAEAPSFKKISGNMAALRVNAVLEDTYVDMTEIGQFMPDLKKNPSLRPIMRKFISASGTISGSMARLRINSLNVSDKDGTRLFVTGVVQNAMDPDRMIATLQQIDIRSGERSIKSWVPAGTVPDSISIPSWLRLQGSTTYSKNNLLTDLRLNSAIGDITINGKASNYTDAQNSRYDVRVPLIRMDVGKLLQDTSLGRINVSFSAKGRGYDIKTLSADVNLLVREAFYNKYRFHDISSVMSMDRGNYNLYLQSKDTNALATLQLEGLIDSINSTVAGTLDLKKLDFYATRLSASPMAAKGNMIVDVTGMQPRHLNGSVLLSGIQFADDSSIYVLDTLNLLASDTISQQQIALTGPFGFITANGDYDYTKAFTDLSAMILQHIQPVDSSKAFIAKETQIMDLTASLRWPGSLQNLMPGLTMEQPLTFNGRLNTDSSLFNAAFLLPGTRFNEFAIDTLSGLIRSDTSKLVSNIYLSRLTHPQFPLERTNIGVLAQKGTLETDITLLDRKAATKYELGAIVRFLPADALSFSLKPELILNKVPWTVSDSNKILMSGGALRSADLIISSTGQSLSVKTTEKNKNATPDLDIELDKFRLSTLTALLEKDSLFAEGTATGKATISNYDRSPLINATMNIDSIKVMNTSLGNLSLEASTPTSGQYAVKAQITGNGNDVAVEGTYAEQLDFDVNLNKLNMASIEPLTLGAANRMSGITSGQLKLTGTAASPQIRGTINFDSVAANVATIGAYLKLNKEALVFDEQGIRFDKFSIADSLNNKVVIDGNILTKDYKDYKFQLDIKADNFMAAGPKQSADQMVYGPAFIDADAKIRGNMDVPRINLNLLLRDSSNVTIVLPEAEPGVTEREGLIVFVDKSHQLDSSLLRPKDSTGNIIAQAGLKGMALTSRMEITPTSTLRIIIDQQNGDFLEVKGTANLDASMTPSSELSVTGRYEISEGSYNMSLNNLIKRKFDIVKGSTITLQGDVNNALLDITTRYRVEAVAGDLVEDQLTGASETQRTQYKQRVPVDVYLIVKNNLTKPEISFRLDMPVRERNAFNGVIYNRIKQINEVESELNKQVMGLLVLNSFIPENPLALVNGRGGG